MEEKLSSEIGRSRGKAARKEGAAGTRLQVEQQVWEEGDRRLGNRGEITGDKEQGFFRLWILLLWRYSRPAWTRSCAACCR